MSVRGNHINRTHRHSARISIIWTKSMTEAKNERNLVSERDGRVKSDCKCGIIVCIWSVFRSLLVVLVLIFSRYFGFDSRCMAAIACQTV